MTVAQVLALADAVPPLMRAMVLTQAGLRLRNGELLALRKSDVEFLRKEVKITAQLQHGQRVDLKTGRSRRVIPLPEVVGNALAAHLAQWPTDEEIFTPAEVTYRKRVTAASGGASPHELRHHYASVLLDAGESVIVVADSLGDTPQMVLSTYGHLIGDVADRTRKAVDAAWSGAECAPSVPYAAESAR